jgi:glycosyltransferase involved in cell wall biosynthesis
MMKQDNKPIFTVVTVVYNAVDTIEKTILSVLQLMNEDVEYIVVDGNSNDGTLDVLEKYKQDISTLIIESDKGIYDAMNKAVGYSSGKWIININAGDLLMYLPFEEVKNIDLNVCAAVCGNIMMNHKQIRQAKYNWILKVKNTLPHQAMFCNTRYMQIMLIT